MKKEEVHSAIVSLRSRWALMGVDLDVTTRGALGSTPTSVSLNRIVVKKTQRREGFGTLAMRDLTALADRYHLLVTLSPSTDFGGTSVDRLKKFYRRFGFVSNTGRHKDFTISDSMYRLPKG